MFEKHNSGARIRSITDQCSDSVCGGVVDLTVEESNRLFETLQDWNDQLSHFDLDDLRCDDDDFAP